jgi:integrase/recombinase XerC
MREAVDEFAVHLALERNRSAHTVRAYADVVSLLDHAVRLRDPPARAAEYRGPAQLACAAAYQRVGPVVPWPAGPPRRVRSRRAARTGLAPCDAGAGLVSPTMHRELPRVLRVDQASRLMAPQGHEATDADPAGTVGAPGHHSAAVGASTADVAIELRDAVIVELLMPVESGCRSCAGWTSTTSTSVAG